MVPRLYAILDGEAAERAGVALLDAASALRDAGVPFVQYRDKLAGQTQLYENALALRGLFRKSSAVLILNDWPEIALAAGWRGLHVGQSDLAVAEARRLLGSKCVIGVSTHTPQQFEKALESDADYIAYGPIFGTTTKRDAETPVGLGGLRQVRELSARPLVAIGGISRERMHLAYEAGADCVAVIGALFPPSGDVLAASKELMQAAELPSGS